MVTNTPAFSHKWNTTESKSVIKSEKKGPSILVLEEKAQVEQNFDNENRPEIPFAESFYMANHDPRLSLSLDTYVQLTMAAGLKVKIKQESTQRMIDEWTKDVQLEHKIENGLYSYYSCGNMLFEHAPGMAELSEVDLATITSARRTKFGDITSYIHQPTTGEVIVINADDIIHFRYTETRKEVWGRGLFNSLFAPKEFNNTVTESPLIDQWTIEHSMAKIFEKYASPIQMITFKDAGEDWIKEQETAFRKIKPGTRIVTDKEFTAESFEVNPASKFDKYIEHLQTNIMETGSQFPLGFFNAEFTTRAAAEITDSVLGRKIKRIQKRLASQIKSDIVMPYLKAIGRPTKDSDVTVLFEIESKSEMGNAEMMGLFEKGVVSRSEIRKHISKKTTLDLDEKDMADTPPITSVTPTNDLRTTQPSPAAQGVDQLQQMDQLAQLQQQMESLKNLVETKIPKPRGRPKKAEEVISTMPEVRSQDDLRKRIVLVHPQMPEEDIDNLIKLMSPIFFPEDNV